MWAISPFTVSSINAPLQANDTIVLVSFLKEERFPDDHKRIEVHSMRTILRTRKHWVGNNAFPVLLFLLFGVAIYSNTLHSPFVFDDGPSITRNPTIKSLENFFGNSIGYEKYPTRFIGYLSFALNYAVGSFDPLGYHIVNLTVHIINSLLVYFFVLITFSTPFMKKSLSEATARSVSLISGIIFLVHPVQTEAVTFVVQRLTSLTTTFFLLSMFYYVKGRLLFNDRQTHSRHKFLFNFSFSLLFCVLAMKTKEISFTLPIVLIIYELFFFDGPYRIRAFLLLPFFFTLFIIPISLINVRAPIGEVLTDISAVSRLQTNISRGDYFLTQLSVIVTYIRLLFLPINQNLDYDYPIYRSLFQPRVFFCATSLIFLFGISLWLYHRSRRAASAELRVISFGIIWFFITLSVESSLIPIMDVIFEHRIYLPSVGAFVALAMAASLIYRKWNRTICIWALIIVTAVLSMATYKRNFIWRDDLVLWSDNVKKSPSKARPHYNMGNSYLLRGLTDKAIQEFWNVIEIDPRYPDAYLSLGVAYALTGAEEKSMAALHKAMQLNPADSEPYYNLGLLYSNKGLEHLAIEQYQKALLLNPKSVNARNNLGIALAESGRIDDAIGVFQQGLALLPEDEDLRKNLENAYKLKSRSR
jgi:Tfp pilus assembly protein PilF